MVLRPMVSSLNHGTQRPVISSLESGKYNPNIEFLDKVAHALGKELYINFQ